MKHWSADQMITETLNMISWSAPTWCSVDQVQVVAQLTRWLIEVRARTWPVSLSFLFSFSLAFVDTTYHLYSFWRCCLHVWFLVCSVFYYQKQCLPLWTEYLSSWYSLFLCLFSVVSKSFFGFSWHLDLPQITGHVGPLWCNPHQTEQKERCPPTTWKQTGVLDWLARLSWSRQVASGRRQVQVGCCWHRAHLKSQPLTIEIALKQGLTLIKV